MIMVLVTILVLALGLTVAAQQLVATQRAMVRFEQVRQFEFSALSARNLMIFALIKEYDQRGSDTNEVVALQSLGRSPEQRGEDARLLQEQGVWSAALIDQPVELDGVLVSVIPESGLVDLASRDDLYLAYVARRFGAKDPAAAVATLRDFTDSDTFVRLNGAEQSSYGSGVTLPNAPLRRVADICKVMHWEVTRLCTDPHWRARVATLSDGRYWIIDNAGETALRAMLGQLFSDEASASLLAWYDLARVEGFFDMDMISGSIGPQYVIILEDLGKTRLVREQLIVLAPEAARPYEILTRGAYMPVAVNAREAE
jgi:hypothetical protein